VWDEDEEVSRTPLYPVTHIALTPLSRFTCVIVLHLLKSNRTIRQYQTHDEQGKQ